MNTKKTILYIEDDYNSRLLLKKIVENHGYKLVEATDGFSGLELVERQNFDLILLDINIIGMNGYEIATRIKSIEKCRNTPLVAITANLIKNTKDIALISGCDGYLTKPIVPDKIINLLEEYIHGKKEFIPPDKITELMREYNIQLVSHLENEIKELKRANEELKEIDKLKSNFISLASHELRTPLMTIIGYIGLLLNKKNDETLKQNNKLLQIVERNAKRLEKIVKDLFTISLLENKIPFMEIRNINPVLIIETVIEDLKLIFMERSIEYKLDIYGDIPYIECDEEKITQVLSNVIRNAIKYTEDNGKILVKINYPSDRIKEKFGHDRNNYIEILVEDTGIGIPENKLSKIFDKFTEIQNIENHHTSDFEFMGGGMGLGLSISKGIVERHNGYIWAENNQPKGAIFVIILPLKISEDVNNYAFISK
ncbi:MAG: hybrid sensor histidine kinase/response regulator [Spirochaetes bacterium]|nr:hybrid sensor histidine kinase/response regulator [Spirochaetota bacterium]